MLANIKIKLNLNKKLINKINIKYNKTNFKIFFKQIYQNTKIKFQKNSSIQKLLFNVYNTQP